MRRVVQRGTAVAAATLAGQAVWARFRGVPSFAGLDPSGVFGDPERPTMRIVVLGDSTVTAPGLDDPDASWPRVVARHLTDRYHVELTCLAEGGATSRDVVAGQLSAALRSEWDVAIVSVGSNDVLHLVPPWLFRKRLDHIVTELAGVARRVILFGVGDLGSIPRLPFPLDRMAWLAGHVADWAHRGVARKHEVPKIDQWRLTTAAFNSGLHMFSPDLFHPSAQGHGAWADALLPTLEEAVAEL